MFLDQHGNETARRALQSNERVACFTPGCIIGTQVGNRKASNLRVGDKVVTRDNGAQEITWIGKKRLTLRGGELRPDLQPILIRRGAIEAGAPTKDMLVSPNHRILLSEETSLKMFDEPEVLVEARHMVGLPGIEHWITSEIEYIHFMFNDHEVIEASGCWSESFHPEKASLSALGANQLAEIETLFPALVTPGTDKTVMPPARPIVDRFEAELMVAG